MKKIFFAAALIIFILSMSACTLRPEVSRVEIDKQVDLSAIILDVPGEDLRVGSFKHGLFKTDGIDDLGDNIRAPGGDVFGNSL